MISDQLQTKLRQLCTLSTNNITSVNNIMKKYNKSYKKAKTWLT